MKIQFISLKLTGFLSLFLSLNSITVNAQTNPYPVSTRAIFLAGCLTDGDKPLNDDKQVYQSMRTCVCLLDKFQDNYTNEQFMLMFDKASQNTEPYKQELNNFVKNNIMSCL